MQNALFILTFFSDFVFFQMIFLQYTIYITLLMDMCLAATNPIPPPTTNRQAKNLAYFDYIQPLDDYSAYDLDNDYVIPLDESNDLSRTIPTRKRLRPQPYNSPIYYIRLPPQPYMFVPGIGYVSQPHQQTPAMSQFVNLPVSFVANGKPNQIYQWGAAFPTAPPPTTTTTTTQKPISDSTVHRLPGHYTFNGKPEDIFVLRDSYNSLYSDALQNFYP